MARASAEDPGERPEAGAVLIARGARATEAALLAEIGAFASAARSEPALLARPLRVVVPSRSLREHLAARLVRAHGRSLAGVSIQTLRGLAFELLRRAGEASPGGDLLFPILVRQAARREPALRAVLDALEDGYGVVTAAVSDLLDAGFEIAHAEAIDEWLEANLGGTAAARGRAVLRVAAAVIGALDAARLEHRSGLFRRAREALERDPLGALPSRRVLVHGYADVTGVQLELIAALVRYCGARVLLDHPDDPSEPGRPDPGNVFTERFLERLGHLAAVDAADTPAPAPPRLELFRAPGLQAEVRSVAERVASLLEGGAAAEEIGVVARDPSPFAFQLRTHFERLGIPFSGPAEVRGPLEPDGRRLRSLLDLLSARETTGVDRWLDASDGFESSQRRDLQLAFHAIGLARLRDVAALDLAELLGERRSYALPLRGGLWVEEESEAAARRTRRRRVPRPLLELALRRARSLQRRFARWARVEELAAHLRALRDLLREDLHWSSETPGFDPLSRRLAEIGREIGDAVPLDLDEFVLLCRRALGDLGRSPLGGRGGGVQVLRVVDARARTFEHLFVMGLNRDLFPRGISEDPLLPDAVRAALERDVLPDIPIKRRGFDEERYLFAELLSASPRVTLSWQAVSDDGKQKTPSPLVERLQLAGPEFEIPLVPILFGTSAPPRLRPAYEHAVLAGLSGKSQRFEQILPLALEETRRSLSLPCDGGVLGDLTRGRLAVLREFREMSGRPEPLGPYFGFLGAIAERGDPRGGELFVTTLESLARCPWQTLLGRLLRLEPLPDARGALPAVDALLIGNLLHGVLERIAREAGVEAGESLEVLAEKETTAVPWPEPEPLEAMLQAQASAVVREAGIALPGFPRVLAERTRPFLERARSLEFAAGDALPAVLGVEARGSLPVRFGDGRSRVLHFRADRLDRSAKVLRLTDYKAGKPVSEAVRPEKRREHFVQGIASGRLLQVPAYAFCADSAPSGSRQVVGRYLFARPDLEDGPAVQEASSDDGEVRQAFDRALRILYAAWEAGSFFPRLFDEKGVEPRLCENCPFSEACLRGDSAARGALARWLERRAAAPGDGAGALHPAEEALRAAWRIAEVEP